MKKVGILLTMLLLLMGCSESETFESGDLIILNKSIDGADTIDDWNDTMEVARETGVFHTGGAINMMFKGNTVMVVKEDKERGMVLVQLMDGSDEDSRLWTPIEDLKSARSK